ncbi:hypothetical protein DUI87_35543 [Hirundo rustica rustica]|uniref:Uncharacterized protein n=1 Tax=Hirundo rustica rustica TaxID=333673 RepID=A0A3M0J0D5_HIRRU|nr:hypothetical protein DUI87_35543 [Hirundo rustica rustica]
MIDLDSGTFFKDTLHAQFAAPLGDLGSAVGHHKSSGSQLEAEEFPPAIAEPMGSLDAPVRQEVTARNLLQRVELWGGTGPRETHGIVSQPHRAPSQICGAPESDGDSQSLIPVPWISIV